MAAEAARAKIVRVLDVWDKWSLYPPHSLLAYRAAFTGDVNLDGEELDTSMFGENGDNAGSEAVKGGDNNTEDIDGEPMDIMGDEAIDAD